MCPPFANVQFTYYVYNSPKHPQDGTGLLFIGTYPLMSFLKGGKITIITAANLESSAEKPNRNMTVDSGKGTRPESAASHAGGLEGGIPIELYEGRPLLTRKR